MLVDRIQDLALRGWARLRRVPPPGVGIALVLVVLQLAGCALFYVVIADLIYDDRIVKGLWPTSSDLIFLLIWGAGLVVLAGCVLGAYLGHGWARAVLLVFQALIVAGTVYLWTSYEVPDGATLGVTAVVVSLVLLLPKRSRRWFAKRRDRRITPA